MKLLIWSSSGVYFNCLPTWSDCIELSLSNTIFTLDFLSLLVSSAGLLLGIHAHLRSLLLALNTDSTSLVC